MLAFNPYNLRARIQPFLLAWFPILAMPLALIPDASLGWTAIRWIALSCAFVPLLAQLGRDSGKDWSGGYIKTRCLLSLCFVTAICALTSTLRNDTCLSSARIFVACNYRLLRKNEILQIRQTNDTAVLFFGYWPKPLIESSFRWFLRKASATAFGGICGRKRERRSGAML